MIFGVRIFCILPFLAISSAHRIRGPFRHHIEPKRHNKTATTQTSINKHLFEEDGQAIAVELLRKSLNQSMDPCEDFYAFTCGAFMANTTLPPSGEIHQFIILANKTNQQLYDLFVDPKSSSSNAINQIKSIFGVCMNYDQKKPSLLLERINEFGGLPILRGSEWDPECYNLAHLLAKIGRSLLSNVLMEPLVMAHRTNRTKQAIYIQQTRLGLYSPAIYTDGTKMQEYADRIAGIVKVLALDAGIRINGEQISREVDKIVAFEKEVANITKVYWSFEERINTAFTKVRRISELVKVVPELNLLEYFKALLPISEDYHHYFASDPEVFTTDYFDHLVTVLRKTEEATVANYVMVRYAMEWSRRRLDDRLENKQEETTDERMNRCIQEVASDFALASQAMYVRKYFDNNSSRNAILEMVKQLRDSFRDILRETTWMDPITKESALDKLDKVVPLIDFPDFLFNDTAVDAYYNGLSIDNHTDSFASVVEKATGFGVNKQFQKLLTPTDRAAFQFDLFYNSANYIPDQNAIHFGAPIFQPPFFHKAFPMAMNFGAIGSLIGHEFTHGFDDQGSKRDGQGYYRVWWEPETQANFLKQKQCIIDQYSTFRVPELNMNVNGSFTAAENIADNGGLKEAYMAYQAYLKRLGHKEKRLRGYERYSTDQLFFIANGLRQCILTSELALKGRLVGDNHAPDRFRVNGVMLNSPEFASAFKCAPGSPMNPEKKCRIW